MMGENSLGVLTVEDVANDLRVTREAVMVMARAQEIPMFKVGRYWRITPDTYADWKHRQEKVAPRGRHR